MKKQEQAKEKLNEVIAVRSTRSNGSRRVQQDFTNCPTLAEQHTAHLSDINYLIERYKPDELQAYINVRNQFRQEIKGHDFSQEPSMQEGKNIVYKSRQAYNDLPDDIKNHFKSHIEFLKFIDNPANEQKMLKLGILTQKQINQIKIEEPGATATQKSADVGEANKGS